MIKISDNLTIEDLSFDSCSLFLYGVPGQLEIVK